MKLKENNGLYVFIDQPLYYLLKCKGTPPLVVNNLGTENPAVRGDVYFFGVNRQWDDMHMTCPRSVAMTDLART